MAVKDGELGMAGPGGEMAGPGRRVIYRGRRWFACCLVAMALFSLAAGLMTFRIDALAVIILGIPLIIIAWCCLMLGFAEAVARVELGPDGFLLVVPRWRGYLPCWPAQRLAGRWAAVEDLSRLTVRAEMIVTRFDYALYTIRTASGAAVLLHPLAGDTAYARKMSANIPAGLVIDEFARRTGLTVRSDGEQQGGGFWRNLLFGSRPAPRQRGA
jgi:hypothetical protein